MRSKSAKLISETSEALAFCFFVAIALILMAWPANARANQPNIVASQQWQLVDQITQSTMLAALGFSSERRVRAIEEARDLFSRDLRALRDDDTELSLVATRAPGAHDRIARLEALWPQYDAALRTIIMELRTAPQVDDTHISELVEIHTLVIEAIDDTVETLGR